MGPEPGADALPTRSAQLLYLGSAARSNHNLPVSTTRVVGRGEVIGLLQERIVGSRLVSIVGAGGMGKTTVALAVAERAVDRFPDGVWMVDFAPLGDGSLVPREIASATGLVVHSADVLPALCRFLRERRILLVLDNCEHMIRPIAACLDQVLREAPGVHVLATSRTALRLPGEWVQTLAGLDYPPVSHGLTARRALDFPAIELFVDRATDRLDTFVLTDEDAPTVAEICRRLDGIALAIELAAMRVDVFGVKGLHKQFDDRFRLLSGRRAGHERHRTLAATLDWSYSLLSPGEARMLKAVSIFAGAFQVEGAASISAEPPAATAKVLTELSSKSLLAIEGDGLEATYRPLETTRAYCLEKLTLSGQDQAIRTRHAEFICAVLERAATDWRQQASRDWGATYGAYLGDLRAALLWVGALPAQRSLQVRLTAAGVLLWNHFSLTAESRIHLARATAHLRDAGYENTAVEMNLQFALAGAILYTQGVVPEAMQAMRRALLLSVERQETDFQLRCLRLIATYELFNGQADRGLRTLEKFLSIAAAEEPSTLAEGETHFSVGELFVGQLHGARRRMERLHAQHSQMSQEFDSAQFARFQYSNSVNILVVLCHAQWLTGSPDAAVRSAELILACARQASHELSLSIALAWNSLVFLWLGHEEDCSRHAAMLDELVEQHGIVTWRPIVTFCRGATAAMRDPEGSETVSLLRRSILEFRAIGHLARLPFYLAVLAEVLAKQGRFQEAEATIHQAIEQVSVQNEQWCKPEVLRIQAFIASAQGQVDAADLLLLQAVALAKEIGALAWELRSAIDLAKLWLAQSRATEAMPMLASIHGAFTEGASTRDLATAALLLDRMQQE